MRQERIKKYYPAVKLPTSFSEEDRGFKRCCEKRLVLANGSSETHENDVNSAWVKLSGVADTYEFQLLDSSGNPTVYVPAPEPLPKESDAYFATVEWADVLASDGVGCYTIKLIANIGGSDIDLVWGEYQLKEFSIENALGTARVSCRFGLQQTLEGINFANSNVRDDLRFKGQIEKGNPNMEIDSLVYNNRRVETVINENLQEWILETDPYTDETLRLLTDLYLLSANEIFISDYNAHTSSYRINDIEATVEQSPEKNRSSKISRYHVLTCILSDRIKDKRAFYGGQTVGPGATNPTIQAPFCLASSYVVEYVNGTVIQAGTIPSGQSDTIVVPDPLPPCDDATTTINTSYASVDIPSGDLINIDIKDQDFNTITPSGFGGSFPNYTLEVNVPNAPESDSVTKPTILDRTFDLDETDLITTSGTIAGAVDGLLITSPEPPKSYINGSTQSGITTVEVNPSDYGWTAMQEYKMIAEFEITSAPVADGQYFGIGKKGRGEKSPRNGSCIYRYSTTNALTYTEYYQSAGASSPTPSIGDIVKLEYIVTDGQVQVLTYLNGTYQGMFSQVYTLSNDLRGRIGTWCIFVYGCDVKLKTLEIIDVAGLTCDNLITGNSEHDGWGGFASNQNRNLHDTMSKSSSYITHNHSVSSSTALDHMNCVKEKARVCIKNHIIHLGTNEKILSRADATIVNEIEALANAVLALKPNVNTYIVLIPPVNGASATALNTLLSAMCTTNGWETIDFATWARTSDTTWDSMYTSDNIHGNLNFKQRCFEEIASNNSELLIL